MVQRPKNKGVASWFELFWVDRLSSSVPALPGARARSEPFLGEDAVSAALWEKDGKVFLFAFMKLSEILAFAEIRTHDRRAEIHLLLPSEQSEPLLSLRPNVRGS